MKMTETSGAGRTVLVQFECGRCRRKQAEPYEKVMTGEHYGYLRNSKLPEGWKEIWFHKIVCKECYEAYEKFMSNH